VPFTRPAEISDGVSLSHKLGREIFPFRVIGEDVVINSGLSLSGVNIDAVIDELSPSPKSKPVKRSKGDALARPEALRSLSTVSIFVCRIVPFIRF
jgi:hypothetical protein